MCSRFIYFIRWGNQHYKTDCLLLRVAKRDETTCMAFTDETKTGRDAATILRYNSENYDVTA